jgi:glycolate oxidase FAD binding subunit
MVRGAQHAGMTATLLQPATGVLEIAERIRAAATGDGPPLRIVGAGTWLHAGPPCTAGESISTASLCAVHEYTPGDLTITVGAGTSLAQIASVTATEGQWLPLDPFGVDEGTIGATVATASAGPLATGFGLPRDMVLGVEVVTGRGVVIRGGGRVVKNVAGFDLVRLLVGSWGTLGVITQVTVRLRARPEGEETLGVALEGTGGAAVERVRAAYRRWPFTPLASEVIDVPLARAARVNVDRPLALFRVAGNEDSLAAQRIAISGLGDRVSLDGPAVWHALRAAEPPDGSVVRLSQLPSRIADTWDAGGRLATDASGGGLMRSASVARGVVRCILSPEIDPLRIPIRDFTGTMIAETLPARAWPATQTDRASNIVARKLKASFDPAGVLNPGMVPFPT